MLGLSWIGSSQRSSDSFCFGFERPCELFFDGLAHFRSTCPAGKEEYAHHAPLRGDEIRALRRGRVAAAPARQRRPPGEAPTRHSAGRAAEATRPRCVIRLVPMRRPVRS
jgi:hypothetical protein